MEETYTHTHTHTTQNTHTRHKTHTQTCRICFCVTQIPARRCVLLNTLLVYCCSETFTVTTLWSEITQPMTQKQKV